MHDTDALVIGAGPVGLFQVFQLGLLGLKVHAVDALPVAGGQCAALYPDKPIYDVPGVAVCTGRELAASLLTQIKPFAGPDLAHLHLGDLVETVTPQGEHGFRVTTQNGLQFQTALIVIAAGAGAFVPKGMSVPGLDGAKQVHYHLPAAGHPAPWAGQHVLVAGGGEEALGAILELASDTAPDNAPARITLMHRRDQFSAEPEMEQAVRALVDTGRVAWVQGVPQQAEVQNGILHALQVLGPDGLTRSVPVDHLLIRQGISPKLGPLSNWGLALERKQIPVETVGYQTQVPGIYAVGDINTYPGKKRLLVCGFHEATMAAHAALAWLKPDEPQHLQYTTTSTLLKQRLGVV
ncbi:MAG: NAD(P)/FAD-dependent oxidoreductase [Acidobacteriota bacterium]